MILRFSVSNYRSIRTEESISLIATTLKEDRPPLPAKVGKGIPGVLPTALVYGANASGKSNLLRAIKHIVRAVLYSHNSDPGSGVPTKPFALDEECAMIPTQMEIDFILEDVRYNFGFSATPEEFTEEWLYSFPEGRQRLLYERSRQDVNFGKSMRGAKKTLSEFMRPNSLFISTATQNNHEELSRISKFFGSIEFVEDSTVFGVTEKFEIEKPVIRFIESVGTGIVDCQTKENALTSRQKELFADLVPIMQKHLEIGTDSDVSTLEKTYELELGHRAKGGKVIYFDIKQESRGTQRLLFMMAHVFKALESGSVLLIDEIDLSLHTHAVERIIELFTSRTMNPNGAQLIATTHDTNLLSSHSLRRDEVWFSEKDRFGSSRYFPMSDIKSRKRDDFERGYLEGRFGAVPSSSLFGD
ncbi:MAG: ATP-binding protein [Maritimibacter sp.]|nr:ATP-binding protein [Maritimibacter sp.]